MSLKTFFTGILFVLVFYFFSFYIHKAFFFVVKNLSERVGKFSVSKEHTLQRYVFLHQSSIITKLYNWVNEQIIALGLKRLGVTPFGYFTFWGIVSFIMAVVLTFMIRLGFANFPFLYLVTFVGVLVMTRVFVSEKMEKREMEVMDAIDLIIPEIGNGVKVTILQYVDNFSPSLQPEFKAFVANIQDRSMPFASAMYILSDGLGMIFKDFAQKAIYYEQLGEADMIDIFTDIIETNRLRRELRDINSSKFNMLKSSFVASASLTLGYGIFILVTDDFSRHFFLQTNIGKILLIIMLAVVFAVLSYISTIKSRAL